MIFSIRIEDKGETDLISIETDLISVFSIETDFFIVYICIEIGIIKIQNMLHLDGSSHHLQF